MTRRRGSMRLLILAWALVSSDAMGGQHRFAIVIGVNEGVRGEEQLLYAERDAVRVADVLTRLGGVASEDMVLMRGADAAALRRAIASLSVRIARRRAEDASVQPVVFLYYSGHAGAGQLHMRGTSVPFTSLEKLRDALGAAVTVVVVDSCFSGGLTRVKGGQGAKPFEFDVDDQLESRGIAILTSSASGEDAQESDRLRGGVFTHHLLTGLIGAADSNRDGEVGLGELWRYAHAQTVRTTSASRFVQHPTYAFKLSGKRELVMTRPKAGAALGRLVLVQPGAYVVFHERATGPVVAEVSAASGTQIRLPPGKYRVRRRGRRSVHEVTVLLRSGGTVRTEQMTELPYGRTVRKGLAQERSTAWSLQVLAEVGGPLLPGTTVGAGVTLGVQLDLEPLALQLRVRYGRAIAENATVSLSQDMLGVDLGVLKVFDIPRTPLGIGLGIRVGGDQIWQRFDTAGSAPPRSQWAWRFGPFVRFELPLHPNVGLLLDAGADIHFVDRLPADGVAGGIEARVVAFAAFGLTFWFP